MSDPLKSATRMSESAAAVNLSDFAAKVRDLDDVVLVEREGEPLLVMISPEMYRHYHALEAKEAREASMESADDPGESAEDVFSDLLGEGS